MTAPAAAPASGPVAPPVQRASAQPPTDRFAFAAVLDALPTAASKAGASTGEDQPHVAKESREDGSSSRQSARHSLLSDGALLASLPFALSAASAMDAGSQAAGYASSPAPAAAKASGAEPGGASGAASDRSTAVGRLVGERAFHFAAGSPSAFASRGLTGEASFALAGASGQDLATQVNRSGETAVAAAFATAEAAAGAGAAQSSGAAVASAPIAPRARASQAHRASPTRATAAHEAVRGERQPEATAAPAARVASSAAPPPRRIRAAKGLTAAFPIRPAPSLRRSRKPIRSARFSQRLSPLRRRSGSTVRRRQPRVWTSRRARARPPRTPRPLVSRSRKSTSIFRRAASRTSR